MVPKGKNDDRGWLSNENGFCGRESLGCTIKFEICDRGKDLGVEERYLGLEQRNLNFQTGTDKNSEDTREVKQILDAINKN